MQNNTVKQNGHSFGIPELPGGHRQLSGRSPPNPHRQLSRRPPRGRSNPAVAAGAQRPRRRGEAPARASNALARIRLSTPAPAARSLNPKGQELPALPWQQHEHSWPQQLRSLQATLQSALPRTCQVGALNQQIVYLDSVGHQLREIQSLVGRGRGLQHRAPTLLARTGKAQFQTSPKVDGRAMPRHRPMGRKKRNELRTVIP